MSSAAPDIASVAPTTRRMSVFSACLPGWSARRVIDLAVALRFPAIEWAAGPGTAIERADAGPGLRALCDAAGVQAAGVAVQDPGVTLAAPQRAAGHVALAIDLGAPHVRLMAPPYLGGSLRREQDRARGGVDVLVEMAAAAGVTVLVETAPGTLAPGPELAARLVEQQPPERAGVLYDPGNMAIEGQLAPPLTVARLGGHLRHVHVKNISWHRRADRWTWRHSPLSTGMLDWAAIVEALAAAGYRGMFSIDHLAGRVTAAMLADESRFLGELLASAFGPGLDGAGGAGP